MAKSRSFKGSKFSFNHLVVVALAFAVIGGAATYAALAAPGGKGGNTGGGTLAVRMVNDKNGDGLPNQSESLTFDVTTTTKFTDNNPFVRLDCYQGSSYIYTASAGFFPGYPLSKGFRLSSSSWTGGAADCKATLYRALKAGTRVSNITTLNFHVSP